MENWLKVREQGTMCYPTLTNTSVTQLLLHPCVRENHGRWDRKIVKDRGQDTCFYIMSQWKGRLQKSQQHGCLNKTEQGQYQETCQHGRKLTGGRGISWGWTLAFQSYSFNSCKPSRSKHQLLLQCHACQSTAMFPAMIDRDSPSKTVSLQ